MRDTAIVFARAPRLGAVKRRLAQGIGAHAALRFHVATMTRLLRALAADHRFDTVLAVTPDNARFRLPVRIRRIPQGRGDLGLRMHRALARYPRGRALIIGCDIPDATAHDAALAFRALGAADAVFGPASDGGYWLIGFGPQRPAHPFANVRWSTADALADTRRNFAGKRVSLLRTLHDIDDVAAWLRHFSNRPAVERARARTPETKRKSL